MHTALLVKTMNMKDSEVSIKFLQTFLGITITVSHIANLNF